MGRKKNKWFKKVINFYRYVFKFELPFNVLIDGNFVAISLQKKFEMKELLAKTIGENVHLVIPSCVVHEIRELESKIPGLMGAVSKYKIEECQHGGQVMSPDDCLKTYIGKKNAKKYCVATQDAFLRNHLRKIPGVPLLFFEQNMILVDKPSKASTDASARREGLKEEPKKFEKKILKENKDEVKEFMKEEYKQSNHYLRKMEDLKLNKLMGRIRKKAKGPNPLSCRKKKKVYEERRQKMQERVNHKEGGSSNNNIAS
jgi:U3 small nucleolar RNA-associated protein 23